MAKNISDAEIYYDEVCQFFKSGKPEKALPLFLENYKANKHVKSLLNACECYRAIGKPKEIIKLLETKEEVLEDGRALKLLGFAYERLKEYDKAVEYLEKALTQLKKQGRDNPVLMVNLSKTLSRIHLRRRNFNAAEKICFIGLAYQPYDTELLMKLHKICNQTMLGKRGVQQFIFGLLAEIYGWPKHRHYMFKYQVWFFDHITSFKPILDSFSGVDGVKMLEIGSYEGMSTCWFVDNILTGEGASITCIDPDFQQAYKRNISACSAPEKVTAIEDYSQNVLPALEQESFDFIYIDGGHTASNVFVDALHAFLLIKTGGIIVFDDYLFVPNEVTQSVTRGVDTFMKIFSENIEILSSNEQMRIRVVSKAVGTSHINKIREISSAIAGEDAELLPESDSPVSLEELKAEIVSNQQRIVDRTNGPFPDL